ncbi:hypothetical protein DBV05_g10087 [Lasiodiplodia theobromae]|uniref:Uncharacterized protein n=1 Tax=Lasiodiplodia theobromae TaxID=45133 RepID=A0A5N5D0Z2_9PEZI|nr:hypothetical protein DBV05_g10087 [Lasiodiplodia theobromae]
MAAATAYRTPFSVDKTGPGGTDSINLKANNGGPLPDIGFLRPSTTDLPIEELRKRYEEDGYLWVSFGATKPQPPIIQPKTLTHHTSPPQMKGLLDRAAVLHMREQYFAFMSSADSGGDTGILSPNTHPRDGIFSGADWREYLLPGALRVFNGLSDDGVFVDKVVQAHVADFYHDFKQRVVGSTLTGFAGRLRRFKEPLLLNRSLLRCNVPGGETTPVHYDQIFLRAGPATAVTGWVPLGDCAVEGGGLMYLEKSVEVGRRFEADFAERNKGLSDEERVSAFNRNMNAGGFLDRDAAAFGKHWGRRWLVAPRYEAGDVVFHDPFMVHASCKNESPEGIIRLSTDLRFVDGAEPFDERWMFEAYQQDDPNVASRQKKVPPADVAKEALETDAEPPLGVNH